MQDVVLQKRRAELIVKLTQQALEAPDVPSAISPILDALVSRTSALGAAYLQMGGQVFHAQAPSAPAPQGPRLQRMLAPGLPDDTPLMRALREAKGPLFYDDTSQAPEAAGFPGLGVRSLAATVVRDAAGEWIGTFLMYTFAPHHWTRVEADLFAAVAGVPANLTVWRVAEDKALVTREAALRALGLALEHRDGETKGHTNRVTTMALRIAELMGLDEGHMQALRWGAYLHDIGKITTPDSILRKPGKLDAEEWVIMRAHVMFGHSLALQLGFLPDGVLDLILYHHERWEGGGYPKGLRREEIPLLARIFAVCDVYDALTSDRPYKRAWSHEEAVHEIEAQSGRHFDPTVVEAFLQLDPGMYLKAGKKTRALLFGPVQTT
jgi:putative nucleotidyltransferase with HDIG domain